MRGGALRLFPGTGDFAPHALLREKLAVAVETRSSAIYAGAIGAAHCGAFRWEKLQRLCAAALIA
jgi:hypothetical protein